QPHRPGEPLRAELDSFWNGQGDKDDASLGNVVIPPQAAVLPRRLGAFPFWRGEAPFLETLSGIYAAASPRGLDVFVEPEAPDVPAEPEKRAAGNQQID